MSITTGVYAWFETEMRQWADGMRRRAAEMVFPDWAHRDGDRIEVDFHDRRDYSDDAGWGPSQVTVSVHRPDVPQTWHHKLTGKDAEDLMDRLAEDR